MQIKILASGDDSLLQSVADDMFDDPLLPEATREFLRDPRHHLAVAIDGGSIVGFASAVHYVHPDKAAPELWINEVGVAPSHQRRGIGKAILAALLEHGRSLGCSEAWVLTERGNGAALRLYGSLGGVEPEHETVMLSFRLNEPTASN